MSRPWFLVDALPAGEEYLLDGPEGHHAAVVQRLRVGEGLVLTDGRGGAASAVVSAAGRAGLSLRLTDRRYEAPPPTRLVVVQAIAKGDRGELAVQAMTEVGVDEIVPWVADRSVAQWRGERGDRSWQRWLATVRQASKQARRAWLPEVGRPSSTAEVVARLEAASAGFVLHESATASLSTVRLPAVPAEIVLVVGPEGGITGEELSAFSGAGAVPVRLGRHVLRTSTAGVAALSVLSARLARW